MQRLQALQPQMKAIQQKYKEDKQRQQQEIMKFYKENKVNPFSSCAPLALQLPVFISLFYMLRSSLRHDICPDKNPLHAAHTVPCGSGHGAGFLFIPDLTDKAHGAVLVALIVLYVGTQLVSTLMMSAPTMDQTQKRLMMFMPLFFVIFIINFPAGVIVYWITTNTWTIAQQYFVRRRLGPVTPVAATAGAGASGGATASGAGARAGPAPRDAATATETNGASGGGLAGLLSRLRPEDKSAPGSKGEAGAAKADAASASAAAGKSQPSAKGEPASKGQPAGKSEPTAVAARTRERREGAPPPPPRKKKKRSGRRR
jgi:YidC/Oxa1 family membrane protein insertase